MARSKQKAVGRKQTKRASVISSEARNLRATTRDFSSQKSLLEMTTADAPYELPDGWRVATLESVLENHRGGVWGPEAQGKKGYPVLRSTNMRGGKLDFSEVARCVISDDIATATALKPGDIIVSKSSGSPHLVGLPALFESNPDGQTYLYSNFTMRLRPDSKQILPKFVFHFLAGAKAEADRRSMSQDTAGLRNLKTKEYLAQILPLPPLPEQRRIVAKIESLFAESRTARDALERVPALLKRFRQSVLASAFRGELTAPQTSEVSKTSEVLPARAANDLPELPEGWTWVKLRDYADLITKGESPKWQGFDYVESGIPFIRSENVLWGKLNHSVAVKIPKAFHQKLQRSQLQPADVLINLVGASIGRVAIVPDELKQGNVNQAVGVVRVGKLLSSEYLMYLLLSPPIQDALRGRIADVARANIGLDDLRALDIPLAPLAEQRRIVAKIEALFAQADTIERAVAIARKRADKVDQAILARAFRGEL